MCNALLLSALALAGTPDIRWTGAIDSDVFAEGNWDLTQSATTTIDPNVTIDDDVIVAGAVNAAAIPEVGGAAQQRFQLADGRTLTIDGGAFSALGNDGVGGSGAASQVTIDVRNSGTFAPFFIVNGVHLQVDGTSQATFGGGGNPVNGSTIELAQGAVLRFLDEDPGAFTSEHLSKVTVAGAPAVVGVNLIVVSDGATGCVVTTAVSPPMTLDADDDLLTDADELNVYATNPLDPDTDGDGTPDGLEVARGLDPLDPMSRLSRPNVIFVLADDLGWGDLGVLFQNSVAGTKKHRTPNLDQLAAEGMLLRRHYCPASVCAPSRASLLLGVHQGHASVRDNQFDKALERNHTLGTTLKRAGYTTALIGKYGLQGSGSSPATWSAYPTLRGFDSFFGYVRHADGHNHYPAHQTAARPPKQVWDGAQEVSADLTLCYTADLWTARAKKFIIEQRAAAPERPFFLYLAYDTPHASLDRPTMAYPPGRGLNGGMQWLGVPGAMITTAAGTIDSFVHPDYAGKGWTNGEERFATAVRRLDDCMGDLVQTLRDLGIDDETLIVFTSDNGPHEESYLPGVPYQPSAFDSFGPFDGIKRDAWEGGLRVPTLAWWPGVIAPGSIDDQPSQFHDWLATFTELAGWTPPSRSDGVSLVPTLTGTGGRAQGTVYVEYNSPSNTPGYAEFDPSHRGRPRQQEQALILDGYKGVRVNIQSHADPFEIYDLASDPRETNNLAGSSPFFVALGQRMLDRVMQLRRFEPSAPRPYDAALVPAVTPRVRPGLDVATFEGLWPWVPNFAALAPLGTAPVQGVDAAAHLSRVDDAGLSYTGYIEVPAAGLWAFRVECDGGAILRIHDALVVDDDFNHSAVPASGTLQLAAGLHPMRLDYRTARGAPALSVRWSGPGVAEADVPLSALFRADTSIGASYCSAALNSSGAAGMTFIEGSPALLDNDVTLVAESVPPGSFGFFLASRVQAFAPHPGGSQGNLCLGGSIGRYTGPGQVTSAGPAGRFTLQIDLARMPSPNGPLAAQPGETWSFQAWHRDANPAPTSNFTAGSSVTFL
ncbi:MAG: sulfatase-like hydrolase/transferase [Planctomycetota bacterium]